MINGCEVCVYSPGTHVKFINAGRDDIFNMELPVGTITEVCIDERFGVKYKVVWWNGDSRTSEWVSDLEFVVRENNRPAKIGFHN